MLERRVKEELRQLDELTAARDFGAVLRVTKIGP